MVKEKLETVIDLTSEEVKPFWNPACAAVSSRLPLPTLDENFTPKDLVTKMLENTWFDVKLNEHMQTSIPAIYSAFAKSFPVDNSDLEVTKTKLIRFYPNKEQKKMFKEWLDTARYVYNQTLEYMNTCIDFNPSWMEVSKDLLKILPIWTKDTPHTIKNMAIKEAHAAWWKTRNKYKPNFKSKRLPEQSCYIVNRAIKNGGIYIKYSGDVKFSEKLPAVPRDSRLIWKNNEWFLAVPFKANITSRCENQTGRIAALDPGIRSFITYYSSQYSGNIGTNTSEFLFKYFIALDNLISRKAKTKSNRKKKSYRKAEFRLRNRIRNLTTELHYKTCTFLVKNFDVIVMPKFETSEMAKKSKRKIGSKTVRSMMTLSFFKFRQRLEWMALKAGKRIVYVSEAYTSKTHPETGVINSKLGGSKTVKLIDGSRADRDLVGARNILLRALVTDQSPHCGQAAQCVA